MSPPREELLRATDVVFACYDLECTGLNLKDELVQLAACACPSGPSFSCYVVPPTKRVCASAAIIIGLQVVGADARRTLKDTRTGQMLEAVDEREALLRFIEWLRQVKGSHKGVVLVSHGAILLDIPVLLLALRRNHLTESFKQVVSGFCDSNGVFRSDKSITRYSLQDLYEQFVGKRLESHRAKEDAMDLYAVLLKYFKTTQLSMSIVALARYTYTVDCMLQYVAWREVVDPRRQPLYRILLFWNKRSPKLRNELVRNLLAADHSYDGLRQLHSELGRDAFRKRVLYDVATMKAQYESYLTDTADLSADMVANVVANHFRLTAG